MTKSPRFNYWTVAATRWREEQRAAHHVERQGFKFYLPTTYETTDGGDGERKTLLFPGFIFVRLRSGWEALQNTRGIASLFLCPLSLNQPDVRVPARLTIDEVERLRSLEDDSGTVRLLPPLPVGSMVSVAEEVGGAYAGISGVVAGTSSRGRVAILLSILGRQVRREFSRSALRAA